MNQQSSQDGVFFLVNTCSVFFGRDQMIRLYLKITDNFMHVIIVDVFLFVDIIIIIIMLCR